MKLQVAGLRIKIALPTLLVGVAITFSAPAYAQAGTWTPPVAVSAGGQGWEASGAVDGNANSVAVWLDPTSQEQVKSSSEPAGGNWGTATVVFSAILGTESPCDCPVVRTSTAGFATAVWRDDSGDVFTADRPPASGWNPAKNLIPRGVNPISNLNFVMNSQGDAAVVWTAGNSVLAVLRPAGGAWTASQTIATATGTRSGPHVTADHAGISDDGAVIATWESFTITCGTRSCSSSAFVLHASRQNPGSGAWVDSGSLLGPDKASHDARVALDSTGETMLVALSSSGAYTSATQGASGGPWSSFNTVVNPNDSTIVSGLASDGAGHVTFVYEDIGFNGFNTSAALAVNSSISSNVWSSPVVLSGGDTIVGEVLFALAPSGTAVTVWLSNTATPEIHAATRASAMGNWSTPLKISGPGSSIAPEAAAVNSAGNALAIYSGYDVNSVHTEYATNFRP